MDSQQFKESAASVVDEIAAYYDTIEDRRVLPDVEPGYLKKLLPDGPPQEGEPWKEIQKDIQSKILPGITHWQSPNFMAFYPANSSFPSMLAELYSAAFTAPAFNWICSPVVTELETVVLDWLAKLLNLPTCYLSTGEGGGVIQGSASEATVTVMVAARDKYLRDCTSHLSGEEQEDAIAIRRSKLVALGSDMAHSSAQKAAQIAGVRYRSVPTYMSDNFAMNGASLKKTIDECKAKGLEPFYLTTTLGTTATCAIDDFPSIATVLRSYCPPEQPGEVWVHVDAAYAGAALILPEYQHLTSSLQHFHSFDMNMHKWLLTNFDASCLFVRNRKHLINAFSITRSYLRNEYTESGLVTDYRDWQIPLGRRFRSLKIWFVMRSYGISGMQSHVRRHIKLGELFHDLLKSRSDLFNIIAGPNFALNVFNVFPGQDETETQEMNEMTKEVYDLVNRKGEIYLTSGVVSGIYAIRVVAGTEFVEERHIRKAFQVLVDAVGEVRGKRSAENGHVENGRDEFVEVGRGLGEAEVVHRPSK